MKLKKEKGLIFLLAFLTAAVEGLFLFRWPALVFIFLLVLGRGEEDGWWGAFWVGFWQDLFLGGRLGRSSFLFLLVAAGMGFLLRRWGRREKLLFE